VHNGNSLWSPSHELARLCREAISSQLWLNRSARWQATGMNHWCDRPWGKRCRGAVDPYLRWAGGLDCSTPKRKFLCQRILAKFMWQVFPRVVLLEVQGRPAADWKLLWKWPCPCCFLSLNLAFGTQKVHLLRLNLCKLWHWHHLPVAPPIWWRGRNLFLWFKEVKHRWLLVANPWMCSNSS
jgi:hypothetical protein